MLTAYEKETIINYNNSEQVASVYTCNASMQKQLQEILQNYPEDARLKNENEYSMTVEIPKSWVKIKPPRIYTKEEQEKINKRMEKMREKIGKK